MSTIPLRWCDIAYFENVSELFIKFIQEKGAQLSPTTHPSHVLRLEWPSDQKLKQKRIVALVTIAKRQKKILFHGKSSQLWHEFSQLKTSQLEAIKQTKLSKRLKGLYQQHKATCFYCLKTVKPEDASTEHLIAVSRGGGNCSDNLALAHKHCNQQQANKPLIDKLAVREANLVQQAAQQHLATLLDLTLNDQVRHNVMKKAKKKAAKQLAKLIVQRTLREQEFEHY